MEDDTNTELAEKQDTTGGSDERAVELEQALASKESEIAGLKHNNAALDESVQELRSSLAAAVSGYRDVVAGANPDIPPELIAGDSLEAIGASLRQARELVGKVKQGIEADLSLGRFPAGAPERGRVETELSPREKIEKGIRK